MEPVKNGGLEVISLRNATELLVVLTKLCPVSSAETHAQKQSFGIRIRAVNLPAALV
jgi:hypothetical protein